MVLFEMFYIAVIFYSVILSFVLIYNGASNRLKAPINIGFINLACSIFAPLITYSYSFIPGKNGAAAVLESLGAGNIIALIVVAANGFIVYTFAYSIYSVIRKPDRKL